MILSETYKNEIVLVETKIKRIILAISSLSQLIITQCLEVKSIGLARICTGDVTWAASVCLKSNTIAISGCPVASAHCTPSLN